MNYLYQEKLLFFVSTNLPYVWLKSLTTALDFSDEHMPKLGCMVILDVLDGRRQEKCILHRPGIEPGPPAWQASILPLNQRCFDESIAVVTPENQALASLVLKVRAIT